MTRTDHAGRTILDRWWTCVVCRLQIAPGMAHGHRA